MKSMHPLPHFLVLAATLLAAACTTDADTNSPAFEAGFSDGCATAQAQAQRIPGAVRRDEQLYKTDTNYRSGWLSGHSSCAAPPPPGS
jgi:hypothetical protein